MQLRLALSILGIALATPAAGWADPPDHAPAHGYRNMQKPVHDATGGFALVFDSERGVQMAVDFPASTSKPASPSDISTLPGT